MAATLNIEHYVLRFSAWPLPDLIALDVTWQYIMTYCTCSELRIGDRNAIPNIRLIFLSIMQALYFLVNLKLQELTIVCLV